MNQMTKKYPFFTLLICILVLQMNSISVRSNTFNNNILGLVPIHSTNTTKETTELRSTTNNLKLQYLVTNASVGKIWIILKKLVVRMIEILNCCLFL